MKNSSGSFRSATLSEICLAEGSQQINSYFHTLFNINEIVPTNGLVIFPKWLELQLQFKPLLFVFLCHKQIVKKDPRKPSPF